MDRVIVVKDVHGVVAPLFFVKVRRSNLKDSKTHFPAVVTTFYVKSVAMGSIVTLS